MNENKDRYEQDDLEPIEEETAIDAELEDIEENSNGKIKKLQQKLRASEQEKMELLESLQRAKAEFLNAKRRLEEEKMNDRQRAVTDQVEKLLPMCDSFHMAMSNKEAWENIDSTWRKGIESIYNQLQSILASYGVKEVTPLGEEFDPNKHEAMTNVPVDSKELHHKVVSVIQNGFVRTYSGKEQLIRPARVTVGEYTE
jgi:molecular chaperone GrpE